MEDLSAEAKELLSRVAAVDADNTAWLDLMVSRHGWPTGGQAARDAWLLAQHADAQVDVQRRFLEAMQLAGADPKLVAYLTDRVRLNHGEPQLFGTQMLIRRGEVILRPLAEPETVDERRASVGLGPVSEYLAHVADQFGIG